jgi:hypothetical protein
MRKTLLLLVVFSINVGATDYYVNTTGSDDNAGTQAAPWQTIAKVNSKNFVAGDRIFFAGGQTFSGSLYFDVNDTGTAANSILISSYGTARATISAGTSNGLYAYNTAGLNITNLIVSGVGQTISKQSGIIFYTDLAGGVKLQHVHINNCDISGFRNGISIGSWNGSSGYNDVRVTNTAAHDNQRIGISTYSQAHYGLTNVYIGHCTAYNNFGDPAFTETSGSGIVVGYADGAIIERCIAHDNGKSCRATAGPGGIWCYDSNNVIIQYNEAHSNHSQGGDGGGFDLDGGVSNSVMQYNYSHDNDGTGFMCYEYGAKTPWRWNIVRYNISQNDSRTKNYGAIRLGVPGNCQIYNNVVFLSAATSGAPAVEILGTPTNVHFRNNILVTTGGATLVRGKSSAGPLFQGNNYWSSGGAFTILWGGVTYNTLAQWRTATSQEKNGTADTGFNVDPWLTNAGGGGTIGNADQLNTLTQYKLQTGSPMINAGLNLTQPPFSLSVRSTDFYGVSMPQGSGFDVGAHERSAQTAK